MICRALALCLLPSCSGSSAPPSPAQGSDRDGWGDRVQRRIAADHRAFHQEEPGVFSALMPMAGLRAQMDAHGLRLDVGAVDGLVVRLDRVSGVATPRVTPVLGGCTEEETPTGSCIRSVDLRYPGVTERWVSGPDGAEQSFELSRPPEAEGPLTLTLSVSGALLIEVEDDEGWLLDAEGRQWTVSGLWAWDAEGRTLRSWMEAEEGALVLRVDAEGASYPVTVDPVYTTAATTLTGAAPESYFGQSVAGAGDVNGDGYDDVAVAALGAADYLGLIYVFHGGPDGLDDAATTVVKGDGPACCLGYDLAGAGDVNGDGYDDLVAGEFADPSIAGSAHVFLGSVDGVQATPITLSGSTLGGYFGWSVDGAGDVNADGYDDVIVGALTGESGAGEASIFLGGEDGVSTTAAVTLVGATAASSFAYSVAGAGDMNGDGFDDVVVGALGEAADDGAAYIYYGGEGGILATSSTTLEAPLPDQHFGLAVAGVGDVNGDGFDDILVATYLASRLAGEAYLFLGASDGPAATVSQTITGASSADYLGWAIAGLGDINADGFTDVVITGVGLRDASRMVTGGAMVYHGGPAGLDTATATRLDGVAQGDYFGQSADGAGDVNGDGADDLVISAVYADELTGVAYIYLGYAEDLDGDGFLVTDDCDDTDALTFPGSAESCDGADNDCDGLIPDGEQDLDGDGWLLCGGDCDDLAADAHPEAEELPGDGRDGDCDGVELCYVDADEDGARIAETLTSSDTDCLDPGEALASDADLDCDDAAPTVYPGADELCEGLDTNCDDVLPDDEGDRDGDGVMACAGDCDDTNVSFGPQVTDAPDDGIDQDCDGVDAHAEADAVDTGEAKGGGCGCATEGASGAGRPRTGWLRTGWLGLGLALLVRRRR